MRMEKPMIEFIRISDVIVTASSNKCLDNWTGGVLNCNGSRMEAYCGIKMAATA